MVDAAARWAEQCQGWAIPPDILAQAPESPWGFPVELFRAESRAFDSISRARELEALGSGGTVLDVGCGGGSASHALVPPATRIAGLDESADMLAEYAAGARRLGVEHELIQGSWPDAAEQVGSFDLVACHHVLYNVADLLPFVVALDRQATRRVVLEITEAHPMVVTAPLWRHFHDHDAPSGPTWELAVEVLREAGIEPQVQRWSKPPREVGRDVLVRYYRRRLCLPVAAEPEVDRVLGPIDAPRPVVTIWWDRWSGGVR